MFYGCVNMSKISDSKVIINIKGGLGNQMFQYAFYKYLLYDGINVYLDIDSISYQNLSHSKYKLDYFDFEKKIAKFSECKCLNDLASSYQLTLLIRKRLWRPIITKIVRKILKLSVGSQKTYQVETREHNVEYFIKNINKESSLYIDGYFQAYKHIDKIKDVILNDFVFTKLLTPKILEIEEKIKNTNSVSIHIRHGDYLKYKKYNICSIRYYQNAIEYINSVYKNLSYFIFSDDIDYIKEKFTFLENYFIVDNSKEDISDYYDLFLMSCTKHNIIANSTFSWWGAYLNKNQNKLVLVPEKWQIDDDNQSMVNLICPPEWIRVPLTK
jgi:hypothetical protein